MEVKIKITHSQLLSLKTLKRKTVKLKKEQLIPNHQLTEVVLRNLLKEQK